MIVLLRFKQTGLIDAFQQLTKLTRCVLPSQIFGMSLITMIFAVLGFLSPANRGGLMTAMLLLFVLMGLFAGYFSAR